jgi:hypothetical protein
MKTMDGRLARAISKRERTKRSDSPIHFDTKSEELTEKKVP